MSSSLPAPGGGRRRTLDTAYLVLASLYVAGLVLWLLLGLLPPLAASSSATMEVLSRLARGTGSVATIAHGALMAIPEAAGWGIVSVEYAFSILNLGLGLVLLCRRPRDVVPRLLSLGFMGTAATFNAPSHVVFHLLVNAPLVTAVHFTFHIVSGVAYVWAVILFPDGRLPVTVGRGGRDTGLLALVTTIAIAVVCYRSSFVAHPPFFVAFFGVLIPVAGIPAQLVRLRRFEPGMPQWQQSRLLVIALVPALAAASVWLLARAAGWTWVASVVEANFPTVFALVPIILAVGILRFRLWDVDRLVSRGIVFAGLAALVGIAYGAALLVAKWLVGDTSLVGAVALTAVAVAAYPVRRLGSRLANRAVFGERLSPPEALRVLAHQLTSSGDPARDLVDVVVAATRCSGAALWLLDGTELVRAAAAGAIDEGPTRLPLVGDSEDAVRAALAPAPCEPVRHDGRLVAALTLAVPPGIRLPRVEQSLVRDLAAHAGLLVTNARLTRDLARQLVVVRTVADDLTMSRAQVVAAQDTERRRLERDLHDGAQQELVAALLRIGTLTSRSTEEISSQEIGDLRRLLGRTRTSIAELAHGSPPEPLVRRGLAGALSESATTLTAAGIAVSVDDRTAGIDLPSEARTALYYCGVEALQNIAKHSRARQAVVLLGADEHDVVLSVADDGVGIRSGAARAEPGLEHLGERLAPIGGTARLATTQTGVTVEFRVPRVPSPPEALS